MKKKEFCAFILGIPNSIFYSNTKTSTLCSAKFLSQEDLKLVEHIFHVTKKALFFTSNVEILQSTFLKKNPHTILIVYNDILLLDPKKKKKKFNSCNLH
jgi:hypothetical protein